MAVFLTAMASESTPLTATPVAKAFVMVLVRFGGDWMAIWRLLAMVGVVEVVEVGGGWSPTAALDCRSLTLLGRYLPYFPPMFLSRKVRESYVGERKLRNPGEFWRIPE